MSRNYMTTEQKAAVQAITEAGWEALVHEHPEIREIDVDLLMEVFNAGREVGIRSFFEVLT